MQLDISERVSSIKQALAAQSDDKAKGAVRKFIRTSQYVYGVRLPLLNQIVKEHREGSFELAFSSSVLFFFSQLRSGSCPVELKF